MTLIAVADALRAATSRHVDTLPARSLDEVVVTATRTERRMGGVSVPVTLVGRDVIRRSGSLRLADILMEQTGLAVVQGFGRGIQMQGLSPEYTLILVDGEPLIGRMGGVLDLSRVTVGNIRRIEIVKGPSSSLYGSEALGGVVNIITDGAAAARTGVDLRYGRFHTSDVSADLQRRFGALRVSAFLNHNASEGYSLLPNALQQTVEPFRRSTAQLQLGYTTSPKLWVRMGLRATEDRIRNSILVQNLGTQLLSRGTEVNKDLNLTPSLVWRPKDRVTATLRGYFSGFSAEQRLALAGIEGAYADRFRQTFARVEAQSDIRTGERAKSTLGLGSVTETVRSNRYDSLQTLRTARNDYFFLQHDWQRQGERSGLTLGLRFDDNSLYRPVWSPKLSLYHRIGERWRLQASVGRGFKAPDFRQLYLNYTNIAAGGYIVFGTQVASGEIRRLQTAGQIAQVLPAFERLTTLRPETSTGMNAGFRFDVKPGMAWKLNLFRNEIGNLILTDIIAFRTGGGQIFSYLNVNRAFTQGLESDFEWSAVPGWRATLGYQLLLTADRAVLADIRSGKVFGRDAETGQARRMDRGDYAGLPGRSRHMANLKVFRESANGRWNANMRLLYRSRWGATDRDGNGIINRPDEFARGYLQVNVAAGVRWRHGISLQGGVDNLTNYRDPQQLPGLPGINPYLTLSWAMGRSVSSNSEKNPQP
jgi:outer membrane receptor for ferrienterochelin and colicins